MKIALDLDGVVCSFIETARKFHQREDIPISDIRWGIEGQFGLSQKDFWDPLGRSFWANLPWTDEGPALLNGLEERFGPENIVILTSPVRTEGCVEGKMDWIRREMPAYARRFLVGPAKEFLASPSALLVDDHDTNCEKFRAAGGLAVMPPRPWNGRRGECLPGGRFDVEMVLKNIDLISKLD